MTVLPIFGLTDAGDSSEGSEPLPFGRWILQQAERGGLIGQLAAAAKSDRAFPRTATPSR